MGTLNALFDVHWREINGVFILQAAATNRLLWHVNKAGSNEDPRLIALLDVNWQEMGFCTMLSLLEGNLKTIR